MVDIKHKMDLVEKNDDTKKRCKKKNFMTIINENKYEIILIIFLIIGILARISITEVYLDRPANIKAADAFYHSLAAQVIIDEESYGFLPFYLAQGYTNMIDPNPPLLYIATAAHSKLSDIGVWNNMYILVCISSAFLILFLFLFTREVFKSDVVGLLAAALMVIPFNSAKWLYPMYIGIWLMIGGVLFYCAMLYLLYKYWKEKKLLYIFLIGICFAATLLIHFPEVIFFSPLLLLLLWKIIKLETWKIRSYHFLALISLPIICFVSYLPRFNELMQHTTNQSLFHGYKSLAIQNLPFNASLITDFSIWMVVLFLIGSLFLIINWKKYRFLIVLLAHYFIFIYILPHFIGPSYYIIRLRIIMPFYVYPVVSYAIYNLIMMIIKSFKFNKATFKYAVLLVTIIISIIVIIAAIPQFNMLKNSMQGQHLTEEKYDALVWLQENTHSKDEVFFLNGYYQFSSAYSKRIGHFQDIPLFQNVLKKFFEKNNTFPLIYENVDSHGITEMVNWAYPITFFKYGYYERRSRTQNILDFDYIIMIDFAEPVAIFNQAAIETLSKEYNYTRVYNKNSIYILKKPLTKGEKNE